jgi:hypothetical protein
MIGHRAAVHAELPSEVAQQTNDRLGTGLLRRQLQEGSVDAGPVVLDVAGH